MDKQEFLKQMIAFGQKLLEEENKPKINKSASEALRKLYSSLDVAVNAAADLEIVFGKKDKRSLKANKAVNLIMKAQDLMNPMAEYEDIDV